MATTETRISLNEFIAQHGITAEVGPGAPRGARSLGRDMAGWTVTIESVAGAHLIVPFWTGRAITDEPTARDVLECLAADAASYENAEGSFRAWADEYGFDVDDDEFGEHERTFRAVETQSANLAAQLGQTAYEQLLWSADTD